MNCHPTTSGSSHPSEGALLAVARRPRRSTSLLSWSYDLPSTMYEPQRWAPAPWLGMNNVRATSTGRPEHTHRKRDGSRPHNSPVSRESADDDFDFTVAHRAHFCRPRQTFATGAKDGSTRHVVHWQTRREAGTQSLRSFGTRATDSGVAGSRSHSAPLISHYSICLRAGRAARVPGMAVDAPDDLSGR